jgi:uncharacterized membrane protein
VSELIAFVFRDQYRAPEVLNELRRRDWEWVRDLDDAVVITLDDAGQARGQFSVDLSKCGACGWARFWRSLLDRTLFVPRTAGLVEAANGVCLSSRGISHSRWDDSGESKESKWWRDSLRDSENFQRDVAALMVPQASAIFLLLRAENAPVVLKQLRNYGDTIVHASVSSEQDKKMLAILAELGEPDREYSTN